MRAAFTLAATAAVFIVVGGAQAQTTAKSCMADYKKLCPDVKPGIGRIAECLVAHKDELKTECVAALRTAAAKRKGATGGAAQQNATDTAAKQK